MQQSSQVFLWDYSRSWNDSSELFRSLGGFTFKTAFCRCCSPPCRCCWTCLKLVARFWNHGDEFFPRDDERALILCCRFFKAASPEAFQLGIRVPKKFAARGDQIWVAKNHCCHLGYASEEQHQGCHFSKEWSEEWIWTSETQNELKLQISVIVHVSKTNQMVCLQVQPSPPHCSGGRRGFSWRRSQKTVRWVLRERGLSGAWANLDGYPRSMQSHRPFCHLT